MSSCNPLSQRVRETLWGVRNVYDSIKKRREAENVSGKGSNLIKTFLSSEGFPEKRIAE